MTPDITKRLVEAASLAFEYLEYNHAGDHRKLPALSALRKALTEYGIQNIMEGVQDTPDVVRPAPSASLEESAQAPLCTNDGLPSGRNLGRNQADANRDSSATLQKLEAWMKKHAELGDETSFDTGWRCAMRAGLSLLKDARKREQAHDAGASAPVANCPSQLGDGCNIESSANDGGVAQRLEQDTHNVLADGSNPSPSANPPRTISWKELERAVSAFLGEARVCSEVHGLGVSSHIENPYEALGKALATLGITVEGE